ncbi:MAG: QueT transporter family protein [Bacillota bacterium]|nr:QueT transporter family protein [Bacillota bacterium]
MNNFQSKIQNSPKSYKLAVSGMIIALYVVIMFVTQKFAFLQYQIRIATFMYALTALFPFLIIPMGIANLISNLAMGGLGPFDFIGGALVGMLASYLVYFISKRNWNVWLIALPIIFVPGLIVPIWLSYLLHIPYMVLAPSLVVGQIIPAIVGVIVVMRLKKIFTK